MSVAGPPGGQPVRFADRAYRGDDVDGAIIVYWEWREYPPQWRPFIELRWSSAYRDGWQRYAWLPVYGVEQTEPDGSTMPPTRHLVLVVAPEVEIITKPEGRIFVGAPPVELAVIRAQRADQIPQPGEPFRLGAVMPTDDHVITASSITKAGDSARQRWLADGTFVSNVRSDWEVRVTVDPYEPGAFGLWIYPDPMGYAAAARSSFIVDIITIGNISVTATQRSTMFPMIQYSGPGVDEYSKVSVSVFDSTVLHPLPRSGLDRSMGTRQRTLEPAYDYPLWQDMLVFALDFAYSMAPGGIGVAYDIAQLTYAASYGETFYGEKVTEGDLLLMGVFCAVGIVCDGGPALKKALKVADVVAPGVRLITPNPGLAKAIKLLIEAGTSPHVIDALRRIPEGDALRLLDEIAAVRKGASTLPQLAKLLDDIVLPLLKSAPTQSGIPVSLFADVMKGMHPTKLAEVRALPRSSRRAIAKAFREACSAGDPAVLQRAMPTEVWSAYSAATSEAAIGRVFTPTLDGFRHATIESAFMRGKLAEGFDVYKARKAARGDTARIAADWAMRQGPSSRYYALLVSELGPDFKKLLAPFVQTSRYQVSQPVADFYKKVAKGSGTYTEVRGKVSAASKRLGVDVGKVLETDHILEQRFVEYFPGWAMPEEEFLCLLVPKNVASADGFMKLGVDVAPYIHSQKTARLRKLIPYGYEGFFTVQEIYDGYRLVYQFEFGMGDDLTRAMLDDTFNELLTAARASDDFLEEMGTDRRVVDALANELDTSPKTAAELLTSVQNAHTFFP